MFNSRGSISLGCFIVRIVGLLCNGMQYFLLFYDCKLQAILMGRLKTRVAGVENAGVESRMRKM